MDVESYSPCEARNDSRCAAHGTYCSTPDRLFDETSATAFAWESVLRPGDTLVRWVDLDDELAIDERYGAFIRSDDPDVFIEAEFQPTALAAEFSVWDDYHLQVLDLRTPSMTGFEHEFHECNDGRRPMTFIGVLNNLVGYMVCMHCHWSEVGPVTGDLTYAMKQPWPDDVVTTTGLADALYGPVKFRAAVGGIVHVGLGATLEEAEFDAFTKYLATLDDEEAMS